MSETVSASLAGPSHDDADTLAAVLLRGTVATIPPADSEPVTIHSEKETIHDDP